MHVILFTEKENVMQTGQMNVDRWVEVFRAIGLEDDDMHKWHGEFEQRYPDGHQSFLEWLELPAERIANIREKSGKCL